MAVVLLVVLLSTKHQAAAAGVPSSVTNSWSLSSPNAQCRLLLSLGDDGTLSYQVWRDNHLVIGKSPLGLQRDDTDFSRGLTLVSASSIEARRERYELFAGGAARVEETLNGRTLTFRNTNDLALEIELAASDQGVAFRYRFPDKTPGTRYLKSELTGFQVPTNARGWLQPYHAAGPYTPAYEDFYFHVSPGDPPPRSRDRPVGWCFPALFELSDTATWMLITESGTDEAYCACHLSPDSEGGMYRIAFPLPDEGTKGHRTQFGPEPRHELPWVMPWRVIVLGKAAGDIATASLVTDLAPASRVADTS